MAICRLNYVTLRVMDLAEAEKHYTDVIGLRVTDREEGRIYFQAHDAQDHHCLIIEQSNQAGISRIGFKVTDPSDLVEASQAAKKWGLQTRPTAEGETKGLSQGLLITLPSGHEFHLFNSSQFIGYEYGLRDPDLIGDSVDGVSPVSHLDHLFILGPEHEETVRFLVEELDFNISERLLAPQGESAVTFLTLGNTMHNLAIAEGPAGSLHHIAFSVPNRADVIRRADLLGHRNITTMYEGLSRHGIGGVATVYFHDPSGNRNEFQSGGYETSGVPGRVAEVTWEAEDTGRAVFFYESSVHESFFNVIT